jgi:MOSC domain-containing protein YiiM
VEFTVESVNISIVTGTPKHPVPEIRLVVNWGIDGDAHAGVPRRQVSFLAGEAVDRMKAKGLRLDPGDFGENIVTRGFDWTRAEVGGRIIVGSAELEITQIGKECHTPCAIFRAVGQCIMPSEGVFARVVKGGLIHAQSRGHYHFR